MRPLIAPAIALFAIPVPARARLLELTFDDGPDGSGPAEGLAELDNLEAQRSSFGVGALTARLNGSAHRSAIGEGRYGRAADFDGAGTIEVTGS